MNKIINNLLQRFTNIDALEQQQKYARAVQALQRTPRKDTFKPRASHGFRGLPRTLKQHFVPAPTIDQVRKLERTYMCRLIVKGGLIYFRDGTPFTHERGKNYRHEVMQEMVAET